MQKARQLSCIQGTIVKEELVEILKSRQAGPFLFVGPGLSKQATLASSLRYTTNLSGASDDK